MTQTREDDRRSTRAERRGNVTARSALPVAYTIDGVLEIVPVSRRTLHKVMASGELPSFKIGRRRYIARSALEAWLDGLTETA